MMMEQSNDCRVLSSNHTVLCPALWRPHHIMETQNAPSLDPGEKGDSDRCGQDGEKNNPKVNLKKNFNSKGHKMQRRYQFVLFIIKHFK